MMIALIIISISLTGYLIVEILYKRMLKREEKEELLQLEKGKLAKQFYEGTRYQIGHSDIMIKLDNLIEMVKNINK